jgi:3'-phosphoadenosine 5'-phosphosulfate sulfotransferase (PAPS reductase)/FAD synthetase
VEKNVICISGGKDSTALWIYATKVLKKEVMPIFCDVGNEHPMTYEYIDYLQSKLGKLKIIKADFTDQIERKKKYVQENWKEDFIKKGFTENEAQEIIKKVVENLKPTGNPFLDLCIVKGRFPSSQARFCTTELKIIPTLEQVYIPLFESGHKVISWVGVRADESQARSRLEEYEELPEGYTIYRPLLKWNVQNVFEIHQKYQIEPNPLYKQGMSRVGCSPCINSTKENLFQLAIRYPNEIERIAEWERLVGLTSKSQKASFFTAEPEKSSIKDYANWSMTAYGGKQVDLLKLIEAEELPQCSSVYGLCE